MQIENKKRENNTMELCIRKTPLCVYVSLFLLIYCVEKGI